MFDIWNRWLSWVDFDILHFVGILLVELLESIQTTKKDAPEMTRALKRDAD